MKDEAHPVLRPLPIGIDAGGIRRETDSMGEIEVPADRYWGAQTERARQNFPVSGLRFQRRFIAALGLIKGEAALENAALGIVDAALAASFDDPLDALARVKALAALKGRADFEPLAVAFKRVVNIIKGGVTAPVDSALFEAPCEGALFAALQAAGDEVASCVGRGAYDEALRTIAALRDPVDAFFTGVMVIAPDERVRTNRLALLTQVARLFAGIADGAHAYFVHSYHLRPRDPEDFIAVR